MNIQNTLELVIQKPIVTPVLQFLFLILRAIDNIVQFSYNTEDSLLECLFDTEHLIPWVWMNSDMFSHIMKTYAMI